MTRYAFTLALLVFGTLNAHAKTECVYPADHEFAQNIIAIGASETECIKTLAQNMVTKYKSEIPTYCRSQSLQVVDVEFGWDSKWNYLPVKSGYVYQFKAKNDHGLVFTGFLTARMYSQNGIYICYTAEKQTGIEEVIASVTSPEGFEIWKRYGSVGCPTRGGRFH